MTAALISALKLVRKKPEDLKVVVAGVGAAGTACTRMIQGLGVVNIIGFDRQGALYQGMTGRNPAKEAYAATTNPHRLQGSLKENLADADLFVGLSGPGVIDANDVSKMAKDAIVFAMSNPDPEIAPADALPHVTVMATGRSDCPNQINNVLCFPGLFRGALDARAHSINEEMKLAAAHAIASTIDEEDLCADYIVPSVFDQRVARNVAAAVKRAAIASKVSRR